MNYYVCVWNPVNRTFKQVTQGLSLEKAKMMKKTSEQTYPDKGIVIVKIIEGVREYE